MAISKFSDISGLITYYNPTDGVPDTTDTTLNSWPPGYSGLELDTPFTPQKGTPTFDPAAEKIGEAQAVRLDAASLVSAHDLRQYPTGSSMVVVYEMVSGSAGYTYAATHNGAASDVRLGCWPGNQTGNQHWVIYTPKTTYPTDSRTDERLNQALNVPSTAIYTMGVDAEANPTYGTMTYLEQGGIANRYEWGSGFTSLYESDAFSLGGRESSSYTANIKVAIFAVYDRPLVDTEIIDIQTLCTHWIENGSEPVVDLPTAESFGPVMVNDLSATLHWEVLLDNDTDQVWQDAVSALSAASVETESVDGSSITGNKLLINSGQLTDSCSVRCRAVTAYSTDGIITVDGVRLQVVGAS